MRIIRRVIVFDASDLEAESGFWAGLLGGTVHRDEDWHSIVVDGEWVMGVQRAPNHVAPASTDRRRARGQRVRCTRPSSQTGPSDS